MYHDPCSGISCCLGQITLKTVTMNKITILTMLLATMISCQPKENQKMNFLFIMTDQQSYDALSIAGNSVLETPNLDQMAKEGAFFRNAYTPCAVLRTRPVVHPDRSHR
jgi:hypothetical protein